MESLIEQTAERIFADHVDKGLLDRAEAPAGGVFPDALWHTVQDSGLHLVGRPDSGSGLGDLFGLLKVAGRHALPLPLAEILVANAVLPEVPDGAGFTTIAVDGVAPWARASNRVLDLDGTLHESFTVEPGANIAGEPRDRVHAGRSAAVAVPGELYLYMGLSRTSLMAGALERTMEMAVDYATERSQFGRPIAKFQAIQHSLAVLAGEVALPSGLRRRDRVARLRRRGQPDRRRQGSRGRGCGNRRRDRSPGPRCVRLHPRTQSASLHPPTPGLARRVRAGARVAGTARASSSGPRRR